MLFTYVHSFACHNVPLDWHFFYLQLMNEKKNPEAQRGDLSQSHAAGKWWGWGLSEAQQWAPEPVVLTTP